MEKSSGALRFEPGAYGLEARMVSLRYGAPHPLIEQSLYRQLMLVSQW